MLAFEAIASTCSQLHTLTSTIWELGTFLPGVQSVTSLGFRLQRTMISPMKTVSNRVVQLQKYISTSRATANAIPLWLRLMCRAAHRSCKHVGGNDARPSFEPLICLGVSVHEETPVRF